MKKHALFMILLICLCLVGCQQTTEVPEWTQPKALTESDNKLVIYSPNDIGFVWPIVQEFEKENDVNVEIVKSGTGTLLDKIRQEANAPQADIMWGGTLTLLDSNKDLFQEYYSKNESDIIEEYRNRTGMVTSFTLIPSVLVVNTDLCKDIPIEGYGDLLNEKLKGKIAHCDPAKSSSAYEQVINILNAMGEGNPENGWPYMEKLMENLDGQLMDGSSDVYKSVVEGKNMVGLTYEENALKSLREGAPVKVVYMKEGVICRADGVAIIKNAQHTENAKKFIDFVTSKKVQEMVTKELKRRPVREDGEPGEGMLPYSQIPIIKDDVAWANKNKEKILERCNEYMQK